MVVKQPAGVVYVMVVVPAATLLTTPEPSPIVATAGVLLIQVPLATACVSVVLPPTHTELAPPIGAGAGVTVTTLVEVQPAVSE
jgi:hypothetical protein